MRRRRDFGECEITEYSRFNGVTQVLGSTMGGLYFVTYHERRYAVIADDPMMAASEMWFDGLISTSIEKRYGISDLEDAYKRAMLG